MRKLVLSILLLALSGQAFADLAEGDQALAAKNYPAAIAAYQAVLAVDPENTSAIRQLGLAFYRSGDMARSLGAYEALLAKQPDAGTQSFVNAMKGRGVVAEPYLAPASGLAAALVEGAGDGGSAAAASAGVARPKFGVRGGIGLGMPTNTWDTGTDESTGSGYFYGPAGGLTYGGEFLWAFHPQMDLGVGIQLIGNSASYSSKDYTDTVTNTHQMDSSTMPVDLTLYAVIPSSPTLDWILGFGPAIAFGGSVNFTDETKDSSGTHKDTGKTTLGMGIGYHAMLGAEYKFSSNFSVLAGLDLESVNLSMVKDVQTSVDTNNAGVVTFDKTYEIEYVDSPPKLKATTFTTNGTVSTSDDGMEVQTYDSATGKRTSKKKLAKNTTMDFNRIAPVLKLTYRF